MRKVSRNKNSLKTSELFYNVGVQKRYLNSLMKLVDKMTFTTQKKINRLFTSSIAKSFFINQKEVFFQDEEESNKSLPSQARILLNGLSLFYFDLFNKKAKELAERMIINTNNASRISINNSFKSLKEGIILKTPPITKDIEEISKSLIAENVNYIKSLPEKYFTDVTGAVMRSISSGGEGINSLSVDIDKIVKKASKSLDLKIGKFNMSVEKRAKLIAYDQTRKAYTSLNKQRLVKAGIRKFEWIHSYGGHHPRASHIKIDGEVFSFENLESQQEKLGVPKKDRGLPGFPVNCKCTMKGVFEFTGE